MSQPDSNELNSSEIYRILDTNGIEPRMLWSKIKLGIQMEDDALQFFFPS